MIAARVGLLAVAVLAVNLSVGACRPFTMADAEQSRETALARKILDLLLRGDIEAVVARLPPEKQTPEATAALHAMASALSAGPPPHARLLGWFVNKEETSETAEISFELTYPDRWFVAQMFFQGPTLDLDLTTLHLERLPAPLSVVNAFSLRGRSATHYLFLLLMAAALGTTVVALVRWFRLRGSLRHKWWWLAGILALPISFSLNWTSGQIKYPHAINFSAGLVVTVTRGGVGGPWILGCAIPIGAIIFLVSKRLRPTVVAPPAPYAQ